MIPNYELSICSDGSIQGPRAPEIRDILAAMASNVDKRASGMSPLPFIGTNGAQYVTFALRLSDRVHHTY